MHFLHTKANVRNSLIAAGLEQAKVFMVKNGKTVGSALINATLPLKPEGY